MANTCRAFRCDPHKRQLRFSLESFISERASRSNLLTKEQNERGMREKQSELGASEGKVSRLRRRRTTVNKLEFEHPA